MFFIITRFNTPYLNPKIEIKYKNKIQFFKSLTNEWLKDRTLKIKKYAALSIKNQTNDNFKWIILFHKDTPQKYINEIKEITDFIPLLVNDDDYLGKITLRNYLKNFIQKDNIKNLILARVDSDDLLHKKFVEQVFLDNKNFNNDYKIINYNYGLCLNVSTNKYFDFYMENSHFFILFINNINLFDSIKLPYEINHTNIPKNINYSNLHISYPLWVQVCHESNICNDYEKSRSKNKMNSHDKNFSIIINEFI